jgi:aspartyl-tRNA(Asn)/glutamyl-tRNA(Gln) amidotransferase subunit A
MLGTYALSAGYYDAYYLKAQKVRTLLKQDFDKAFEKVDVLVGPVAPFLPFPIGERIDNPLAMYLVDIYTVPVNLAGLPALSLPCGRVGNLPVGLQLIAKPLGEPTLFRVGKLFESIQNTTNTKHAHGNP